jgi:hypothetical protein
MKSRVYRMPTASTEHMHILHTHPCTPTARDAETYTQWHISLHSCGILTAPSTDVRLKNKTEKYKSEELGRQEYGR